MLAFSLRYPTPDLAQTLISGEWDEAAREISSSLAAVLPGEFGKALTEGAAGDELTADELFHVLRAEATRLFIGPPSPVVSPYEGIWRAEDDGVEGLTFINPHSMAVEQFMKSCALARPVDTNEPLDHIATEFELLQMLAAWAAGATAPIACDMLPGGSARAAFDQFFGEHLSTWASRFAVKVRIETRLPYYRSTAMFLEALLPRLS